MRKSKNITKYEINWQVVRFLAKKEKNVEKKLKIVNDFFINNLSIDNKERCLNWLEGLAMSYRKKNEGAIVLISQEVNTINSIVVDNKEQDYSEEDIINNISKYNTEDLVGLWKDLFKRNEKWLKKGYIHEEQNNFMDILFNAINSINLGSCSYDKLLELRASAKTMKNTHNFFF